MTLSSETDKIILLGLAESGKTTILKVISEGYVPDKKAPYTATMDYTRKKFSIFGKTLTIFDLGGQKAFMDRFIGELAEFIFSGVKVLIYVVDIVEVTRFSLAKYYLDLALKRIKQYSPTAVVYVFLHKIDLIDRTRMTEFCNNVKNYLSTELEHPVTFFETSVFSNSIFDVFKDFKDLITSPSEESETINTLITEFVRANADLVTMTQIFTKDGQALIENGSFTHIFPGDTRQLLNTILQHLGDGKEQVTAAFLETAGNLYFVQFLEKNHVLLLSFSQTGLTAKQVSIPTIYHRVLHLTQQLNNLLS
ncbi:MAG: ADP-ribosylation factor-like protein [Candidatus Hermodarchaeota archaeon]